MGRQQGGADPLIFSTVAICVCSTRASASAIASALDARADYATSAGGPPSCYG